MNSLSTTAYSLVQSTLNTTNIIATYYISVENANTLKNKSTSLDTAFNIDKNIFAHAVVSVGGNNTLNTNQYFPDNIITDYVKNIDVTINNIESATIRNSNPNYAAQSTNSKSLGQDAFNIGFYFGTNVLTSANVYNAIRIDCPLFNLNDTFISGDTFSIPVALIHYNSPVTRQYTLQIVVTDNSALYDRNYPKTTVNNKMIWTNNPCLFNNDYTPILQVFKSSNIYYPNQLNTSLGTISGNTITSSNGQLSNYEYVVTSSNNYQIGN